MGKPFNFKNPIAQLENIYFRALQQNDLLLHI